MIAMDSKSGREVAHVPTVEGMDGVYFDTGRKRVYVSGGRELPVGFAYVYQQKAFRTSASWSASPFSVNGTRIEAPIETGLFKQNETASCVRKLLMSFREAGAARKTERGIRR